MMTFHYTKPGCSSKALPASCRTGEPIFGLSASANTDTFTPVMSTRHPKAEEWEERLKAVFDRIDDHLEDRYGHLYPLHPARPSHGRTSNREEDGLFNVGAAFSAGFGSQHGPGYVIEVRMSTLSRISAELREKIENEVAERLREDLPKAFPGRELRVERDGPVYKIFGDLSLGSH